MPGAISINGKIRGLSGFLLARLGISEDELRDAIAHASSEGDVAAWLRERSDPAAYPEINATLQRIRPKHADDEAYFRNEYADTLTLHPDLEFIIDIVDADDKRRFP